MASVLQVGVGRTVITPPIGTMLYGYAPGRPAESVGDDLTATAIALASGGTRVILISATICAINTGLCDRIRKSVGEAAGIPMRQVTLSATHTHSGPNTSIKSGWGEVNETYIETIFVPRILEAAALAVQDMKPAKMGIAEINSDIGINRRELTLDGRIILGQNPWGAHDPVMTVISFRGDNGKIITNLVHYCCHCTASGCNPEITRDWAGPMIDRLEEQTGGITAFFAGAEGDQGPNLPNGKTTGNYRMALDLGAKAGIDAVRAWRSIKDWQDVPVGVICGDLRIPYLPLTPRLEAMEKLAQLGTLDRIYAEKRFSDVNSFMHWSDVIAEQDSGRPPQTEWIFPQSIIAIGSAAFIPFPFEVFIEIALRIRRAGKFRHMLSLCNTHGCLAYFPSLDQIARGGYEVWHFRHRNLYSMVDDADNYAVAQNVDLANQLYDKLQGI